MGMEEEGIEGCISPMDLGVAVADFIASRISRGKEGIGARAWVLLLN
jgi:hypothetical protein